MAFKSSELVEFCKKMVGQPYWYGTVVYRCTESRLTAKAKQYPSHYSSSRMSKYRKAIAERKVCMDCVGMIKGFFWTNGGQGVVEYINGGGDFANTYQSNGCPDKSANGMLSWCKQQGVAWGTIDTMPDKAGIPVYMNHHVGLYIGNGEVIEARGFSYGVVKTKLKDRPWKHWAYLPDSLIDYNETPKPTKDLGYRLLHRTSPNLRGDDIAELQTRLTKLGYDCGKADGVFGKKTETAIIAFQTAVGIEIDGKFGVESLKALKLAEQKKPSIDEIAKQVLDGKWGNGSERRKRLEAAGYNYREIQDRVNAMV